MSSEIAKKLNAAAQTFRALGCERAVSACERLLRLERAPTPECHCCGERGEGFKTRQGDHMCFDCANREFREAQENADADRGDMERKGTIEEALVMS